MTSEFYFSYTPSEEMKNFAHEFSYTEHIEDSIMHISEFHAFCRKLALMCGYSAYSVEEYFGEERENPLVTDH